MKTKKTGWNELKMDIVLIRDYWRQILFELVSLNFLYDFRYLTRTYTAKHSLFKVKITY